jgi:hypothetical protein
MTDDEIDIVRVDIDKIRREMRWKPRKTFATLLAALAIFAAGLALGAWLRGATGCA